MTSNPYLKRLLGEAAEQDAATELATPTELEPSEEADAPPEAEPQAPPTAAPNMQELIRQWQAGDHMAVAARLMFTEASYADFVDMLFAIGHEQGRMLGQMLDELADTEGIEPPTTPPEYQSALQHAGNAEEENVI